MSTSWRRLVLFDIDGTLLSADRSGYEALERSVIEVLEAPRGLEGIRLDGNTDLNALRQISARDGTPFPSPDRLARFKARYAEILAAGIQGRGHLKPGVADLLQRLSAHPDVCLGLVTGNFREGAQIKLSRFGIAEHFRVGAFGCEDPERAELIRRAVRRAGALRGQPVPADEVIMVGDTINDITASQAAGVRVLAVATGAVPLARLAAAAPTWVLPDLADAAAVEHLVLS